MEKKNGKIKNIFDKSGKFINGVAFSFSVSWKASRKLLLVRVAIVLVTSLLPFVLIILGREILNSFVRFTAQRGDTGANIIYFARLAAALFGLEVTSRILQKLKDSCGSVHKDMIGNYLNIQMINKSISLDLSYFDSVKFYNELTNAKRDSVALETLTWLVIDFTSALVQFIIAVILLLRLNILIVAILVFASIPVMISEKRYIARLYNWQRNNVPEERKMNYLLNILTGRQYAKDVRLYRLQEEFVARHQSIWRKWFRDKTKLTIKKSKWVALFSVVPEFVSIAALFYVGVNIIYGNLTVGDYSYYNGNLGQLTGSIFTLVMLFSQIYDNDIRLGNYKKFLQWESNIQCGGTVKPSYPLKIEFVDICFKYPGNEEYVLYKVNFTMYEGEKIALVGHNGAGKSTVVKLLLRFYDPTSGNILANGTDIREYDVDEYRRFFSVLFQDYANYAFTLKENITMSDFSAGYDEIKMNQACHNGDLNDIVKKYETGFDTYLTREFDENGKELSGGEWQRVALARTFFRNGSIIILDEPSASLDPEAEHYIFQKFAELYKGKGAILISHRLSNVTISDRIILLEKGCVLEHGSHSELMKKSGRYAYLFNLQADKYKVG